MTESNGKLVPFEQAFGKEAQQTEYDSQWFTAPAGVRLKIAPMDNPKYIAKLRELLRPHVSLFRRQMKEYRKDTDSTADLAKMVEIEHECQLRAVSACILHDWERIADPSDLTTPLKYTPQIGYDYFKKYPKFFAMVTTIARDEEMFQQEVITEEVENS